jgi:Short C-terminal domain
MAAETVGSAVPVDHSPGVDGPEAEGDEDSAGAEASVLPTSDSDVAALAAKLRKRVVKALEENLTPGEMIVVVIRGAKGQAIVGSATRAFVLKPGFMAGASFGAEVTSWSYRNLVGVQLHKGMVSGSVVLQGPGQSGKRTSYWGSGDDDPWKAPNAIPVAGDWNEVKAGVAKLRSLIDVAHNPEHTAAPPASPSVVDELKKLAELKDSGVLSDEEFAAAKRKLLET